MKIVKKIFKIIAYSLLSILVVFSVYTLIVLQVLGRDYVNVFGYTYFVVASGSMSGTIEVNDIIIVKINDNYEVDDIITYNDEGSFITHRVVKIEEEKVITRGDVNNLDDSPVPKDKVVGRVVFIVSISVLLKIIALIVFIIIIVVIINFEKIFRKYVTKEKKKSKKITPLEYTQIINKNNNIPLVNNSPSNEIELLIIDEEEEFLDLVLKILKLKNKKLKLTKDGSLKLKYVYEFAITVLIDPDEVINCLNNIPFEELYDYDFDDIGFTKNVQDKLYDMPIYIYFKLLTYTLIYDENEYFDAIFKILKYRIRVDKDGNFIKNKKRVNEVLALIEKIVLNIGREENFELTKIKQKVMTNKEIRNIELKKENMVCPVCGGKIDNPYLERCRHCGSKIN